MHADHTNTSYCGLTRFLPAAVCLLLTLSAMAAPAAAPATPTAPGASAPPAAAVATAPADAKDRNPHLWAPKVTSVAVFKNGLGFFLRQGDVELRDGWCLAKEVPPAAFGTLAVFSHAQDQTVDIVGAGPGDVVEFDGVDAAADLNTKRQRLSACRNLSVQLSYKRADAVRTAAGKLKSVEAGFVILDGDANSLAVAIDEITRLQVLELPIRVHVLDEAAKAPAKATLGMAYLRKGITWIPEYTLKVVDDDTAELTLRGTVVNEAEDLVHCDVHLVVGVPHFVHTDFMAPLAVGQMIRTIGAAIAPAQVMTQIMNRAALVSQEPSREMDVVARPVEAPPPDLGKALGNLPQMEAPGAATDYTVYTKKDMTLRRGEKAIVTLFRKAIKYSHVYRWTLPGQMEHLLVLQNATDTAWTTGPCLVIAGNRPLGEDLLKYVPQGASGEMPVTAAINIAQERSESETARRLKVHEPSNQFWVDLVTIQGKLQVKNFEKRPATVIITAPIPGKPTEASDDGKITIDTTKLQLMEQNGSIRWKITLEPGASKTLTYVYEKYVPSR